MLGPLRSTTNYVNIRTARRGRQRMRWLDGITDSAHGSGGTLGVSDGQGGLVCYGSWRRRVRHWAPELNWILKNRNASRPFAPVAKMAAVWLTHGTLARPHESSSRYSGQLCHLKRRNYFRNCPFNIFIPQVTSQGATLNAGTTSGICRLIVSYLSWPRSEAAESEAADERGRAVDIPGVHYTKVWGEQGGGKEGQDSAG